MKFHNGACCVAQSCKIDVDKPAKLAQLFTQEFPQSKVCRIKDKFVAAGGGGNICIKYIPKIASATGR